MRYEFIEPFVSSTIRVLDRVMQCDISKGGLALVDGREVCGDVVIMINLGNHTSEKIIVNMDRATALNICGAMNGEAFDSLGSFEMDALSELANMIAGNAVSALNDLGFDFKVSPPRVISKDDIQCRTGGNEIFQVPLFTEFGEVTVNALLEIN